MPPTPKPPGQRRRRNAKQAQWRQLPAEGRKGKAPPLPKGKWLTTTREWWKQIWASPMATVWLEADLDGLIRLARLKDSVARDVEQPSMHAQITALEDRFGLSPKARRQLQWEISQASEGEEETSTGRQRHLRAVR